MYYVASLDFVFPDNTNNRSGFCPNVTFEDDEFRDNKALNDQVKDEGTIIVTAQLYLNMSWSLT
jgi:hypothetical protein